MRRPTGRHPPPVTIIRTPYNGVLASPGMITASSSPCPRSDVTGSGEALVTLTGGRTGTFVGSVTGMPVPAPRGYLINPYKQGDRMIESSYESVQIFIGVDVGKDTHHAVAVNHSGKRLFDKALPNDENKLRALISDLKQHGQILLVVDQPAVIAEAARTLPHALRTLKLAVSMLCGFDDDLAAQTTQTSNCIRGLLHTQNESGKTTQPGLRRPVRHDARRDFLYPCGIINMLDNLIGAPP